MKRNYPDAWIQTFTGRQFWPLEPSVDDVCIEDIVHALSNICRYGGHSRRFLSVAEHSVLVSYKAGLHGLLHDAAEAYIGDWVRPIKQEFPVYNLIELKLLGVIYVALGLRLPTDRERAAVFEADNRVLATEKQAIHSNKHPWALPEPYPDMTIECLDPIEAEALFWHRLYELDPVRRTQ